MSASNIPDIRDHQERADIAAILAALPEQHQARVAYSGRFDTLRLTHLAPPDLVDALKEAFLAGYRRLLHRHGGHFRP